MQRRKVQSRNDHHRQPGEGLRPLAVLHEQTSGRRDDTLRGTGESVADIFK